MIAFLALALLATQDPPPDLAAQVRRWVDRLQAESLDEREEACAALIELGPAAVPHLRPHADSRHPEVRARVEAAISEIERQAVLREHYRPGARVTIDARAVPMAELVRELARQSGEDVAVAPGPRADATIRLSSAGFWTAVDALARAADLSWRVTETGVLAFGPGPRDTLSFSGDGEFAVWIQSVAHHREFSFTGTVAEWITLDLHFAWQRHVRPLEVAWHIAEAIDDGGTHLLDLAEAEETRWTPPSGSRVRHLQETVTLGSAGIPAGTRKLARFAGVAQFLFPTRYERHAEDWDRVRRGAEFKVGSTHVWVRNVQQLGPTLTFHFAVRSVLGPSDRAPVALRPGCFAVEDAAGRRHDAAVSVNSTASAPEEFAQYGTASVTLPPGTTLRQLHVALLRGSLTKKIPFDFRDVPVK